MAGTETAGSGKSYLEPDVLVLSEKETGRHDVEALLEPGGSDERLNAAGMDYKTASHPDRYHPEHNEYVVSLMDLAVGRGLETDELIRNGELLIDNHLSVQGPVDFDEVEEVIFYLSDRDEIDNRVKTEYTIELRFDDRTEEWASYHETSTYLDGFEELVAGVEDPGWAGDAQPDSFTVTSAELQDSMEKREEWKDMLEIQEGEEPRFPITASKTRQNSEFSGDHNILHHYPGAVESMVDKYPAIAREPPQEEVVLAQGQTIPDAYSHRFEDPLTELGLKLYEMVYAVEEHEEDYLLFNPFAAFGEASGAATAQLVEATEDFYGGDLMAATMKAQMVPAAFFHGLTSRPDRS